MAGSTEDAVAGATGWRVRAACRPLDSAIFFPDRTAYRNNAVAGAKAVCRRCPVREECLAAAIDGREKIGIWGGLTPLERANLHRRRRRARTTGDTPRLGGDRPLAAGRSRDVPAGARSARFDSQPGTLEEKDAGERLPDSP